MIVYFIFQNAVIGDSLGLAGAVVPGLGSAIAGLAPAAIGQVLTVGAGAVVPMILAGVAAVLCFLSENAQKPVERTAGLGSSADDEW